MQGPQYSWSIQDAKKNKTFICEFKAESSVIEGSKIESIFAEKQYKSDGGFFSGYQIDSCKSQIVFVSKDYLTKEGKGYGVNWQMEGFQTYSGKIIFRKFNTSQFPGKIKIKVFKILNDTLKYSQMIIFHKVNPK
jgi:hypothetical protein